MKVKVKAGIAYFPTFESARDIGRHWGIGFPAWRVVSCDLGHAIQVRPGGDYFGPNGLPSMQNAINAFDRA